MVEGGDVIMKLRIVMEDLQDVSPIHNLRNTQVSTCTPSLSTGMHYITTSLAGINQLYVACPLDFLT